MVPTHNRSIPLFSLSANGVGREGRGGAEPVIAASSQIIQSFAFSSKAIEHDQIHVATSCHMTNCVYLDGLHGLTQTELVSRHDVV